MIGRDPRVARLLAAARAWRASLAPRSSVAPSATFELLIEAIRDLDADPAVEMCVHRRAWLVFNVDGSIECSTCGVRITTP